MRIAEEIDIANVTFDGLLALRNNRREKIVATYKDGNDEPQSVRIRQPADLKWLLDFAQRGIIRDLRFYATVSGHVT